MLHVYQGEEYVVVWDNSLGAFKYKLSNSVDIEETKDIPRELQILSKPSEDPTTWVLSYYKG